MNDVFDLIAEVHQAGVTLRADPPDLVLKPAGRVQPELKTRILAYKQELLAYLGTLQEDHESVNRLIEAGNAYIQITARKEEIYIALTDGAFADLSRDGVTVYRAAHLIPLSPDEIRLTHSLRIIGGSGGSMEIKERTQ